MNFTLFGKVAGAVALSLALSGCIDVTMEVAVQSDTEGKATMTSTMGKDFYAMVKASGESDTSGEGFCEETDSVLTENEDGSATCVQVSEGVFSELEVGEGEGATFEVISPGVVRVAFKTENMASEVQDDSQDEETKAMMAAFFDGHFITMRISGKRVTDTNMTLAADGASAETKIPFLDLINGSAEMPAEFFAVVDTN